MKHYHLHHDPPHWQSHFEIQQTQRTQSPLMSGALQDQLPLEFLSVNIFTLTLYNDTLSLPWNCLPARTDTKPQQRVNKTSVFFGAIGQRTNQIVTDLTLFGSYSFLYPAWPLEGESPK